MTAGTEEVDDATGLPRGGNLDLIPASPCVEEPARRSEWSPNVDGRGSEPVATQDASYSPIMQPPLAEVRSLRKRYAGLAFGTEGRAGSPVRTEVRLSGGPFGG